MQQSTHAVEPGHCLPVPNAHILTIGLQQSGNQRGIALSETYQLFKSDTCGFCHRVRAYVAQLGMDLPVRDIHAEAEAFRELLQGGGRSMVPCLRIERGTGDGTEVEWMYESMDIMRYLGSRQADQ
jgi:glutaredoxin